MARQPVTPIAEMDALTQSQRMRLVEEYRACGLEPNTIRGREWADKAWNQFCTIHQCRGNTNKLFGAAVSGGYGGTWIQLVVDYKGDIRNEARRRERVGGD
jgi:hypothetical protein